MNQLATIIPQGGQPITVEAMEQAERQIALHLNDFQDIPTIEEMRDRMAAIEEYARRKQMHLPVMGAQRRLEARIGQLLGDAEIGRPEKVTHAEPFLDRKADRHDFRLMARILNGDIQISDDEWRQSRRALVGKIKTSMKEREDMEAVEAERQKTDGRPRLTVPEGQTVADVIRSGMAMEAAEPSVLAVATKLRMNQNNYSRARDIVALADNPRLTERDRSIARQALDELNKEQRVKVPYQMVEPIIKRMWGDEQRTGDKRKSAEENRIEAFNHSMGVITTACYTAGNLEVPYIDAERANEAIKEIGDAISNLSSLRNRIKEIYQ